MTRFLHLDPSLDAYWRAIILFGRNSATYKFALGKTVLGFAQAGHERLSLEQLAAPFAREICEHLKLADRQGTAARSKFLDACRLHNEGRTSFEELVAVTQSLGFVNVIDAFHIVGVDPVGCQFFVDDRKRATGGIALTDDCLRLASTAELSALTSEIEARWRLVETAWNVGIAPNLLNVGSDQQNERLVVDLPRRRRVDVTSVRDALNGYQKGTCFYCFAPISPEPGSEMMADVDHFFPMVISANLSKAVNLNGVWNLVLACRDCNRGVAGKSHRIAALRYIERLEVRNNFLIDSHHPLRETMRRQTGASPAARRAFLQEVDRLAVEARGVAETSRWLALNELPAAF